jgi:hypothetical protein
MVTAILDARANACMEFGMTCINRIELLQEHGRSDISCAFRLLIQ